MSWPTLFTPILVASSVHYPVMEWYRCRDLHPHWKTFLRAVIFMDAAIVTAKLVCFVIRSG